MSESDPPSQPDEILMDLLIKQVTEGLSPAEQRALDVLDSPVASAYAGDFERAAAAIALAGSAGAESLPPLLRARLEEQAQAFFASAARARRRRRRWCRRGAGCRTRGQGGRVEGPDSLRRRRSTCRRACGSRAQRHRRMVGRRRLLWCSRCSAGCARRTPPWRRWRARPPRARRPRSSLRHRRRPPRSAPRCWPGPTHSRSPWAQPRTREPRACPAMWCGTP